MNGIGSVYKARELAALKHKHLSRPNRQKQPVIEHLQEVSELVRSAGGCSNQIAAAWLHDIVEDTDVSVEDIKEQFGVDIAEIVEGLTDPPEFSSIVLVKRKQLQAERLRQKSNDIKLVKLCDQISNVKSVLFDPPLDWSSGKCIAYAQGAKGLADICRGISPNLDNMFDDFYNQVLIKYRDV